MPRSRRCRPLGLVELIVVIVIIGILAAIAVVGYQAVIDKTEVEAAKQELLQEGKQAAALAAFEQAPGGGSADPADHTTADDAPEDRKTTRLNSSTKSPPRMPSPA